MSVLEEPPGERWRTHPSLEGLAVILQVLVRAPLAATVSPTVSPIVAVSPTVAVALWLRACPHTLLCQLCSACTVCLSQAEVPPPVQHAHARREGHITGRGHAGWLTPALRQGQHSLDHPRSLRPHSREMSV